MIVGKTCAKGLFPQVTKPHSKTKPRSSTSTLFTAAPEKHHCVDTCILTSALHAYTTDRNHRQPEPNRRKRHQTAGEKTSRRDRHPSKTYQQHDRAHPDSIHPDTIRAVSPPARMCGRCHNQQRMGSNQCATSLRKGLPELEAQLRGLAPSRNCHDAADRVKGSWRWIAGYETADQRVSRPDAGLRLIINCACSLLERASIPAPRGVWQWACKEAVDPHRHSTQTDPPF